jgi:hypothetical protein
MCCGLGRSKSGREVLLKDNYKDKNFIEITIITNQQRV